MSYTTEQKDAFKSAGWGVVSELEDEHGLSRGTLNRMVKLHPEQFSVMGSGMKRLVSIPAVEKWLKKREREATRKTKKRNGRASEPTQASTPIIEVMTWPEYWEQFEKQTARVMRETVLAVLNEVGLTTETDDK